MKRKIDGVRVRSSFVPSEHGESKKPGDGRTQEAIVPLRLFSKPKETEKDECAEDGGPTE